MNEEPKQQVPVNGQQLVAASTPDVALTPISPTAPIKPQVVKSGRNPKKLKVILIAIVASLILGGGGLVAFYMYMNNKPEKVLADALTNTAADVLEGKPAAALGELTFKSKGTEGLNLKVKFDSKVSADNMSSSADATAEFGGKTYKLKVSVLGFGDEELYFKIENLKEAVAGVTEAYPVVSLYAASVDPIITKLDNKWVKLTKDDLASLGTETVSTDKCAAAIENLKLSKSDQKQLKKLFKENQFIVASENLKTDSVEGESSFHYKLDFNNAAAESFATQVINMQSFSSVKTDCDLSEAKLKDSFKEANKTDKSEAKKPVVELWVGKDSRRPTKFKISSNDKDMTLDFNTRIKLNADDVKIAKPTDSISIKEIQAEFEKLMPTNTTNLQTL